MPSQFIQKAIILAAGSGDRLYPITSVVPKPMAVVGGLPIIERLLLNLKKNGVTKVVIVTGYREQTIREHLEGLIDGIDIFFIHNDRFDTTNNIYSLWLAGAHFDEDFLLLESDVVCDAETLAELVSGPPGTNAALVSPKAYYMDRACVELQGTPLLVTAPKQVPIADQGPQHYKTVNFYRIAADFCRDWLVDQLRAKMERDDLEAYYETLFAEAIATATPRSTRRLGWTALTAGSGFAMSPCPSCSRRSWSTRSTP